MDKRDESSSFCRGCVGRAEVKVMCPLIGSLCGFGCVSLSHCKHCSNFRGFDLEIGKVDCAHGKASSEFVLPIKKS